MACISHVFLLSDWCRPLRSCCLQPIHGDASLNSADIISQLLARILTIETFRFVYIIRARHNILSSLLLLSTAFSAKFLPRTYAFQIVVTVSTPADGIMASLSIFLSNALLSALSISNLGLISSMVGFLHDQKDHVGTYQVNWPGNTVQLKVEPEHLWTDQGHESNGVAGYGFFLGLFGLFVAWRQRRRDSKVSLFVSCNHWAGIDYMRRLHPRPYLRSLSSSFWQYSLPYRR